MCYQVALETVDYYQSVSDIGSGCEISLGLLPGRFTFSACHRQTLHYGLGNGKEIAGLCRVLK